MLSFNMENTLFPDRSGGDLPTLFLQGSFVAGFGAGLFLQPLPMYLEFSLKKLIHPGSRLGLQAAGMDFLLP
jgi:hypothetical protein